MTHSNMGLSSAVTPGQACIPSWKRNLLLLQEDDCTVNYSVEEPPEEPSPTHESPCPSPPVTCGGMPRRGLNLFATGDVTRVSRAPEDPQGVRRGRVHRNSTGADKQGRHSSTRTRDKHHKASSAQSQRHGEGSTKKGIHATGGSVRAPEKQSLGTPTAEGPGVGQGARSSRKEATAGARQRRLRAGAASMDSLALQALLQGSEELLPGNFFCNANGSRTPSGLPHGGTRPGAGGRLAVPLSAKLLFRRYAMRDMIGKGRYGTVWKCADQATGQERACKQLDRRENAKYLIREMECLRRVQGHPNVLSLEGVYESELYTYLVTEFCDGGDLFEYLSKKGFIEEEEAQGIFGQLVEAVLHCHRRGVIHRDIKPENVLLHTRSTTGQKVAKLADFGLAKRLNRGETAVGWVGSEPYEAPEVIASKPYDFSADVFSLGVVLFGLLSGTWPCFLEGRVFDAQMDFSWPGWWKVSKDAKCLIEMMLQTNPLKRPTMAEVLRNRWLGRKCVDQTENRLGRSRTVNSALGNRALEGVRLGTSPVEHSIASLQTQDAQSTRRSVKFSSRSLNARRGEEIVPELLLWEPVSLSRTKSGGDSSIVTDDCGEESKGRLTAEGGPSVLPSPVDSISEFSFANSAVSSPGSWCMPTSGLLEEASHRLS